MLSNIRTSLENKGVVTNLTYKLQLGPENIIARIALSYSLATTQKLDLKNIKDAKGKEYSMKVLLGNSHGPIYVAMICQKYNVYKTNTKDISRYIKMHVDDGLEKLQKEYQKKNSLNSFDFFFDKIEKGLQSLTQ